MSIQVMRTYNEPIIRIVKRNHVFAKNMNFKIIVIFIFQQSRRKPLRRPKTLKNNKHLYF